VPEVFFDPSVAGVTLGLSLGMLVVGALVAPVVIARMPADYFVRADEGRTEPPLGLGRLALRWLKNLFGLLLFVIGVAMLVLPGQGLLTMLIGLSLISFPGKRRLERRILRIATVERVVQLIRRRAGRPPLRLEPPEQSARPDPHSR
jgi:hypothetical protein